MHGTRDRFGSPTDRRQRLSTVLKATLRYCLVPVLVLSGCLGAVGFWRDYLVLLLPPTLLLTLLVGAVEFTLARSLALDRRRADAGQRKSAALDFSPDAPALLVLKPEYSFETASLQRAYSAAVWRAYGVATAVLLFATLVGLRFLVAALLASAALCIAALRLIPRRLRLDDSMRRDVSATRGSALGRMIEAAPVLYLRSFGDDARAGRRYGTLTEEEHLAKALAWLGPLVAVGRPGDHLPDVGAQRIYLTDDEWQMRVTELMISARVVVIRTGLSSGLDWELERAVSLLQPAQLLVVADDSAELQHSLDTIARHVGRAVESVRLRGRPIGSVRGLVVFDTNWRPRLLRLRRATLRVRDWRGQMASRFVLTLAPLFELHGVSYRPPAVSWVKVILVLTVVFYVAENLRQ